MVWFDSGGYPAELWETEQLFKMLYELRPDLLINNRCGVPGDFTTPEQRIGLFNNTRDWESCMTFTGYWSWHGFQTKVKPYEECLRYLISCAGGDGNLLMNIGPMPTGEMDPREAARLKRIGQWLEKNGEAIYATRGGPYKPGKWGAATHRGNHLYLLITDWNQFAGKLPPLPVKILQAQRLSGESVSFTQSAAEVSLAVEPAQRAADATVIKLELAGPAEAIAPIAEE
jgi:alpha-L-fucosidase